VITIAELDDKLVLDNYIKDQRLKGFNEEEIRDQLNEAGWDKALVEEALKSDSAKADCFIEKTDEVSKFSKFSKYLTEEEAVTNSYVIGHYDVLLTNDRVILIKKFPRNVTKIEYEDIELVEYFTDVDWMKLVYSVISGILTLVILIFNVLIFGRLSKALPFLKAILGKAVLGEYSILALVLLVVFGIMFISNIVGFFDSFMGRLRIIPKKQGPKDLVTKLTKDTQDLISFLEIKKKD